MFFKKSRPESKDVRTVTPVRREPKADPFERRLERIEVERSRPLRKRKLATA